MDWLTGKRAATWQVAALGAIVGVWSCGDDGKSSVSGSDAGATAGDDGIDADGAADG
ncbi:MAG: hypothetical protein JKY37_03345, partial [Nannocystaceae bacterium]|nr:hypothetical protein [Nannocystaceae bacterium]